MPIRTIYLIRHAQHDRANPDDDALEGGLTPAGQMQADWTARRLQGLPVQAIFCSDLRRTQQTAAVLARCFPALRVRCDSDLRECVPVIPPLQADHFTELEPGEVSRHLNRAERAFARYFHRTDGRDVQEILVTHGNLLRYFVCRALDLPAERWTSLEIYNCGITEFTIESNGRTQLVSHNDSGHLPSYLKTFV
jgi:serine/threonine-protein phosphatase PGAM5